MDAYVVFSIDNEHLPAMVETFEALLNKHNIGFAKLLGSYKGQQENSWIVNGKAWMNYPLFELWTKHQESVLMLSNRDRNNNYEAKLLYGDGRKEALGTLREVSEAEALQSEAWTKRMDSGKYYLAK